MFIHRVMQFKQGYETPKMKNIFFRGSINICKVYFEVKKQRQFFVFERKITRIVLRPIKIQDGVRKRTNDTESEVARASVEIRT